MSFPSSTPRREFLLAAGLAAAAGAARPGRAAGDAELKIALVGCGGRGIGAVAQALRTRGRTRLVAMADAFEDRLEAAHDALARAFGDRVAVPREARFTGLRAYRQVLEPADVVLLASPPGFLAAQAEAAVRAGRHVFLEAPVAVDPPGVRRVLATSLLAAEKGLCLAAGFQRRRQPSLAECVQRIQEGALGGVTAGRVYANDGGMWMRARDPSWTELQYQVRNWYYFTWLSGDHVVEQLCHHLDAFHWAKGAWPVRCNGMGGRQVRTGKEFGEIFDHHFLEYEYEDGTFLHAQARQMKNTYNRLAEVVVGPRGGGELGKSLRGPGGEALWSYQGATQDPFQATQDRFFAAIRSGETINDGEWAAKSTLSAILGRMASYTGREVTWDEAVKSNLRLGPEDPDWDSAPPVRPDASGNYPIPRPGMPSAP